MAVNSSIIGFAASVHSCLPKDDAPSLAPLNPGIKSPILPFNIPKALPLFSAELLTCFANVLYSVCASPNFFWASSYSLLPISASFHIFFCSDIILFKSLICFAANDVSTLTVAATTVLSAIILLI